MAQIEKALTELEWIRKGLADARQWRDWNEVVRQMGRINHTMELLRPPDISDTEKPPFKNIGQPCGGSECDGHLNLCEDCGQSHQDYRDSFRP